MTEAAIELRNVTKCFGSTCACRSISLAVRKGITYGVLGPNGAGKSTLIRMLMDLTPPDAGEVTILGCCARRRRSSDLAQRIGYVPELHFIYRWMTVGEVIGFVSGLYRNWDSTQAEALREQFDLPANKRVSSLSKGMTAKLGLLLALSHSPELLILDEPTSGLDPVIREDFLQSVLQSHSSDRTIIFSSHHVDDVERVADEVGIIVNGRLVIEGPIDELRARVKRARLVMEDGRLPSYIPEEVMHQTLDRRQWTATLNPFSE